MTRITLDLADAECPECGTTGATRKAFDVPVEAPGPGDPEGAPIRYRFDQRSAYLGCREENGGCGHRWTDRELASELARQNPDVSLDHATRAIEEAGS